MGALLVALRLGLELRIDPQGPFPQDPDETAWPQRIWIEPYGPGYGGCAQGKGCF